MFTPLIDAVITLVIAFAVSALVVGRLIPFLKKKQFKQYVREEGPQSHLKKTGTPSMGGIGIISGAIIAATGSKWVLDGSVMVRPCGYLTEPRDPLEQLDDFREDSDPTIMVVKGLIWPLFLAGAFYLIFVGALTLLFGYLEKKLNYYKV